MFKKGMGYISIIAVLLTIGYIAYQKQFTYIGEAESFNEEEGLEFEGETLLLIAEERNVTGRKKGFDGLSDNLSFWKIDGDEVLLREFNLMPNQDSSVLFIYNRDNNTFENQSNIIPISNFPYNAYQNDTSFKILHIEDDGTALLEIQDKKIKLEPGKVFYDIWLDNFQLRNIKLRNEGFFKTENFKTFDDKNNVSEDKEKDKDEKIDENTQKEKWFKSNPLIAGFLLFPSFSG